MAKPFEAEASGTSSTAMRSFIDAHDADGRVGRSRAHRRIDARDAGEQASSGTMAAPSPSNARTGRRLGLTLAQEVGLRFDGR